MPVMIAFENSSTYAPIRLTSRPFVVGRSSKASLKLDDDMCSGQHASLHLADDGSVILTDLNSTNGTYVNETLVSTAMRIYIDDVIRVGNTRMWIDKSALGPRELVTLKSQANKTLFTKIELKVGTDSNITRVAAARKKAIGLAGDTSAEEGELGTNEESSPEISVVFDQESANDLAKKRVIQSAKAKAKLAAQKDMSGVDSVFDLEESSGKTKMIKLERPTTAAATKRAKPVTNKPAPPRREKEVKKDEGLFGKVKKLFGSDD